VEKYKDVPLKRPKPEAEVKKKPVANKPKAKSNAAVKTPKKTTTATSKKTASKPKSVKKAATSKPVKGKK